MSAVWNCEFCGCGDYAVTNNGEIIICRRCLKRYAAIHPLVEILEIDDVDSDGEDGGGITLESSGGINK
jgi:hypothetical protein